MHRIVLSFCPEFVGRAIELG